MNSKKLGQFLSFGFKTKVFNEELKNMIQKDKIGNFCLFGRNIGTFKELASLNYNIYSYCEKILSIKPIISVDQEGGMVSRLFKTDESLIYFPSAKVMSFATEEEASLINSKMNLILKKLGFNMNLAPVLDINNNPNNPVIGQRSYGDNINQVKKYSLLAFNAMKAQKIIACGKHFPGHGDTEIDSHHSLPKINKNYEELKELELIPFINLLENGLDVIMIAHIIFSKIDDLPCTLSKKMLDILINDLCFKGLIISDCMRMKAIEENFLHPYSKSLSAGMDICGTSRGYTHQQAAIKEVKLWIKDNERESDLRLEKIIKWKEKNDSYLTIDPDPEEALRLANCKTTFDLINKVYIKSFLSNDKNKFLNLSLKDYYIIDFIPYSYNDAEGGDIVYISFFEKLKSIYTDLKGEKVKDKISNEYLNYNNILIISFKSSKNEIQRDLIKKNKNKNLKVIYTVDDEKNISKDFDYLLMHEYSKGAINAFINLIGE